MKIDLDELERKATAAPFGTPPAVVDDGALTLQAAGYHDQLAIESMVCELRHHRIKQEVMDTVPALIARIRELEAFIVDARGGDSDCGGLPHFMREEADALLEKGVTCDS